MTVPKQRSELIDALLAEHGTPTGDGRAAIHPCEGTKFHSPSPLTTICYEAYPGKQVWLCPTCLSKLQCFLFLHGSDPAAMTWDVMREFGNQIRLFGQEIIRRADRERTSDA